MIASDRELRKLIEEGCIYVDDGPAINLKTQLGPSSVDLRLGEHFMIFQQTKADILDTRKFDVDGAADEISVDPEKGIIIHPGQFILGSTLECVSVPTDMAARVEGRSSYGRLGIAVHSTAGYIDPGFQGQITLEIQNLGVLPVRLYPGERVCQVVFERMTSEAEVPYHMKHDAKYHDQKQTTLSRLDREKRD